MTTLLEVPSEKVIAAPAQNAANAPRRILLVDDDTLILELITDNAMSRVAGLELIKKLRSAGMTLPIILASGTEPTEELQYPWLQPEATLLKPFTISELLDMVKG